jgi:hypothetical protein
LIVIAIKALCQGLVDIGADIDVTGDSMNMIGAALKFIPPHDELQEKGLTMLKDGLSQLEQSISKIPPEELDSFDAKKDEDWIRIFAPVKPILKEFLQGKDPTKMGVQLARDRYGKSLWLCKSDVGDTSNLLKVHDQS